MSKPYTKYEIDTLLSGVQLGESFSDLEKKLDRSISGIMQKLENISEDYPDILNEKIINEYRQDFTKYMNVKYKE